MNLELRILSGLHRGASLPLIPGERLSIGAAADCDVVLVDPELGAEVLWVSAVEAEWHIERAARHGNSVASETCAWGTPFNFNGVVLTICEGAQAWAFTAAEQVERASASTGAGPQHVAEGKLRRWWRGVKNSVQDRPRNKVIHRLIIVGAVMFGFATISISRTSNVREEGEPARRELRSAAGAPRSVGGAAVVNRSVAAPVPPAAASQPAVANAAELKALLLRRLKDVYLIDKLELDLTDTAWNMRGALDDEDRRQFEHVMAAFLKEHKVTIPMHAHVSSAEELLPFRIQQFQGGPMSHVVTADGTRLYVGDSLGGYVLQRIDGRRVVFAGKRKVEIIW